MTWLPKRAHSHKQPALVATTFLNFQGVACESFDCILKATLSVVLFIMLHVHKVIHVCFKSVQTKSSIVAIQMKTIEW